MTPRDDATAAQVRAAQPGVSTWLSANAGSGKTRVLTDRVARLLLERVEPQHILCLTYTKAAASEMQNRLFRRLGAWAMLEDDALLTSLRDLGVEGEIDSARLRQARTLFARAIETPGGLKIQTIHSFCAALLRRFPLEARVSPQFVEMEDRAADLLRAEIVDSMADGEDAELVRGLAHHFTGEDFGQLTRAIVQKQDLFQTPLDRGAALALFDQAADLTEASIQDAAFQGNETSLIEALLPVMKATGKTDPKLANRLERIPVLDFSALPELESIFLYASGENANKAKTGTTSRPAPSKASRKSLTNIEQALDAFLQRIEVARTERVALKAVEKTLALHRFAQRFLQHYEHQKVLRGWLDFDDLINRARALLNDEKVAAWVLFRIDGGIDHILVDEAQDTSPAQWDVIRKLADEFTSGQGARADVNRTIFVVGDKKQSIYSFQGADPREFDRMRSEFEERINAAGQWLQNETLHYSFRSSAAILRAVDQTFKELESKGFQASEEHIPFKSALPGRVDIWPVIPKTEEADDDRAWYDPVDRKGAQHHTVVLANQIASQIKQMIDNGQTIPADGDRPGTLVQRPVTAGDFLILVQRRSDLFSEIIRACKAANLKIAGADRLKVGAELAVRDLGALLSFLAMPEDGLSLATALRSPLFGWSEKEVFQLAHYRKQKFLWEALRDQSETYPKTMAVLNDLRKNLDFLRPYDLIERILTRHQGRKNLLSRLGPEAEDGINALLSQALAYERNAIPSLTGFLVWMETDDLEIKRQMDSASDQIRVMTVHGAKGLEAPIVILPDTAKRDIRIRDEVLNLDGHAVWKTPATEMPEAMQTAIADLRSAEESERQRLLYVALTRAEKWLILAACGDLPSSEDSWYQTVDRALDRSGASMTDFQGLTIKRLEHGAWDSLSYVAQDLQEAEVAELDDLYRRMAPIPEKPPETLSPSDLGGAKALPGDTGRSEEEAMAYGTLVHRILEHAASVSPEERISVAEKISSVDCSDSDNAEARAEALKLLDQPDLAFLFARDALNEVAITAPLGKQCMYGSIDKLIISGSRVTAVDFKTNQIVPDDQSRCPEGLLRQMGAYLHGLKQVYPEHEIDLAILWTRTANLMPLSHEIVTAALKRTPYLDEGLVAS